MLLYRKDINGNTEVRLFPENLHEPAVQETRRQLLQLAGWSGEIRLRLDFGRVRELPAGAIGAVVAAYQCVQAAGGRLVLVNLSPELCEVFRVTGLDGVLDLQPESSSCGVA